MVTSDRFPLRAPALGDKGMVAAPHHLASLAGVQTLQDGGNALDAAIAANSVMQVVWPHMCSLGGDLFLLIKRPGEDPVGLMACGSAGANASISSYRDRGVTAMPRTGALTVTVPGVVDGWEMALDRFGRKSLGELLRHAVGHAENGFPVTARLANATRSTAAALGASEAGAAVFLPGGQPLSAGRRLTQPDLAWSLKEISRDGRKAMYEGMLGHRVVSGLQAAGGVLELEDLARHSARWVDPISLDYRGYTIHELPPPTQGLTVLQELGLVEPFDLAGMGHNTADTVDMMVRARNLAFEDRDRYIADPLFVDVPVGRLLDPDYLAERRGAIDEYRVPVSVHRGALGDTIYLCTADADGMVVSLIQSLYFTFGSRVMAPGTGFMLHNRGASFNLDPEHPNRLEGGKRPMHTLIPGLATRDGQSAFVFGTRGADGQPQTQFQMAVNLIDFGLDAQQAVEAPRWCMGGTTGETPPDELHMESRFGAEVLAELADRGYKVKEMPGVDDMMGTAACIVVNHEDGYFVGGVDPRGDGAALGH